VNRVSKFVAMSVVFMLAFSAISPLFAAADAKAEDAANAAVKAPAPVAASTALQVSGIGAGLVILGAGYGIGRIGSCAVESMARQPEVAGNVQTAMIISAALIEGATFFALIVCIAK